MQYSNLPPKNLSQTEEYFSNYFTQRGYIDPAFYEVLIAYFEKQTGKKDVARITAAALIQTAIERNINIKDMVEKFNKISTADVNKYIVSLLNISRKNTSFLGFKNNIKTSNYVTRTILP